jgi:hypothetical protein
MYRWSIAVGSDDGERCSYFLGVGTGSFYGFLFSVPGQAEGFGQRQGGVVQRKEKGTQLFQVVGDSQRQANEPPTSCLPVRPIPSCIAC